MVMNSFSLCLLGKVILFLKEFYQVKHLWLAGFFSFSTLHVSSHSPGLQSLFWEIY